MHAIVGGEKEMATGHGKGLGSGARGARADVLDQDGADGSAVTLPQLDAVNAVVGGEEQGTARDQQVPPVGPVAARDDVLDQASAGRAAVTLPEFETVRL